MFGCVATSGCVFDFLSKALAETCCVVCNLFNSTFQCYFVPVQQNVWFSRQIAKVPKNMTAPMKGWNAVVVSTVDNAATKDFNHVTDVQAKLIAKPSREYIYELLTKMRFPLIKIETIIERRGNTVDFTCKDRISAESLQRLLDKHPNVREARLFESEFIDVKLTGVPHRLPDGKIIAFLNKRNGEVLCTKRLKDRKGYFDGRRMHRM